MRPIVQLTDAAHEIELTRDPTLRIPQPEAEDEIAELARTLGGMLAALDAARNESETALARQREFVADASHELRTPLTAVLANLELLADELDGEQADSAKSALRSTRRMRRLVGDLLLLARTDAQRPQKLGPTDLAEVLTEAAAELGAVTESHELTIDAHRAIVHGSRDDLHRVALNLLENGINHTPAGTSITASTGTWSMVRRLWSSRTTALGFQRICADTYSSGSSAPAATGAAVVGPASGWRSSRPSPMPTTRASSSARPPSGPGRGSRSPSRGRRSLQARNDEPGASDLDDDRQHHRAATQPVIDERRDVVVQLLLEQRYLADPIGGGGRE